MLDKINSFYFIGIGGVSMSALAVILKKRGFIVKGSDIALSALTAKLEGEGIEVEEGNAPHFVKECDVIVFTGAVLPYNEDLLLAKKLSKPIFSRADILGMLSQEKKTISIAGTHGKTTTTGMISNILLRGNFDPTIHIGGELKAINSNFYIRGSDLFVTEACEYQDAFLSLSNYISVVLNIEEDHLDYFKNFDNIKASFNKFIRNTDKNGAIVYNFDNCNHKLDKNILNERKCISFGFEEGADLQAVQIEEYAKGKFSFKVKYLGKNLGRIYLSCFGRHNIYNAMASIGVSLCLGVDFKTIADSLKNFSGIARRMEIVQESSPLIIHDYAHHPQEIEATLKTIKALAEEKLICIFQPHTFTRTKALYQEFLSCFSLCDEVWLLPIYPAREKPIKGVSSWKLKADLVKNGQKSRYFSTFERCKSEIIKEKYKNYTFAILGAGDIEKLAKMLSSQY